MATATGADAATAELDVVEEGDKQKVGNKKEGGREEQEGKKEEQDNGEKNEGGEKQEECSQPEPETRADVHEYAHKVKWGEYVGSKLPGAKRYTKAEFIGRYGDTIGCERWEECGRQESVNVTLGAVGLNRDARPFQPKKKRNGTETGDGTEISRDRSPPVYQLTSDHPQQRALQAQAQAAMSSMVQQQQVRLAQMMLEMQHVAMQQQVLRCAVQPERLREQGCLTPAQQKEAVAMERSQQQPSNPTPPPSVAAGTPQPPPTLALQPPSPPKPPVQLTVKPAAAEEAVDANQQVAVAAEDIFPVHYNAQQQQQQQPQPSPPQPSPPQPSMMTTSTAVLHSTQQRPVLSAVQHMPSLLRQQGNQFLPGAQGPTSASIGHDARANANVLVRFPGDEHGVNLAAVVAAAKQQQDRRAVPHEVHPTTYELLNQKALAIKRQYEEQGLLQLSGSPHNGSYCGYDKGGGKGYDGGGPSAKGAKGGHGPPPIVHQRRPPPIAQQYHGQPQPRSWSGWGGESW